MTKKFRVGKAGDPVAFEIDDDAFEAIPVNKLPAGALAKYFSGINDNKLFEANEEFFKAILTEDSQKIFFDRLYSTEKPITLSVLGDVASWLLGEVYMSGEATVEPKQS